MTGAALMVLGGLLVAAVFADALVTTLSVGSKEGWLTRALNRGLWHAVRWTERARHVPSLLAPAGVLMLVVTVGVWVALLWLGTTLVLLGGDPAVVDATSGEPANVAQVVYFAGFTVFTLGVGDYVAASDGWRVFTAAMSWPGLVLITLAITYLLSVVSAVVHRRSVAIHVRGLGATPSEVVAGGWDGSQFSSPFQQHLVALSSEVSLLAEQHLAYPVLQYFHTGSSDTSAPLAVAMLDDALMLLEDGVAEDARPPRSATRPLRHAIERHLTTSKGADPDGADAAPLPDLGALAAAGVPVVPAVRFADAARRAEPRRARLASFVEASGWSWAGESAA